MCAMCVEIMRSRMTSAEAIKARGEFIVPEDHAAELDALIAATAEAEAKALKAKSQDDD